VATESGNAVYLLEAVCAERPQLIRQAAIVSRFPLIILFSFKWQLCIVHEHLIKKKQVIVRRQSHNGGHLLFIFSIGCQAKTDKKNQQLKCNADDNPFFTLSRITY
jgi:hypothetical protein